MSTALRVVKLKFVPILTAVVFTFLFIWLAGRVAEVFLLLFQMMQLPLIALTSTTGLDKINSNLSNWIFWVLLIVGLPTIVICYSLFAQF